jgi:hypothetical protein
MFGCLRRRSNTDDPILLMDEQAFHCHFWIRELMGPENHAREVRISTQDCKQLHIPLVFEVRLIAAPTSKCAENIYPFALTILRNINCSYSSSSGTRR